MLYTFGDSFTWGKNFSEISEEHRVKHIWPTRLAEKLNVEYTNLAVPASSNWRTARKLLSLNLTKDDIVIISWSDFSRFEFGVNTHHNSPSPKQERPFDIIEVDGNIRTRKFNHLLTDRTTDKKVYEFNKLAYDEFYNEYWFQEMFRVMFNSCCHTLEQSGCKWLMFNAWAVQYDKSCRDFDIPQYLLGQKGNMTEHIRGTKDSSYWSEKEHETVADLIQMKLSKVYG
jgi:hypothetical protein